MQLVASQLVPDIAVKAILFPGACLNQALNGRQPLEVWQTLLQDYNMTDMGTPDPNLLPRLEVINSLCYRSLSLVNQVTSPRKLYTSRCVYTQPPFHWLRL